MEIGEAVGRYEQAAALLPSRWQQAARACAGAPQGPGGGVPPAGRTTDDTADV